MTTSVYRYLFGPVPSRRLGRSLGVDLVPSKTCTLDCVYCESGATTKLTVKRGELVPNNEVKAEIDRYLSENDLPDAITFSGAGEPTLHSGIGDIAAHIKSSCPDVRLVLLTNGTLFDQSDVREDACQMDLVIASYDAADASVFDAVNRPHPKLSPDVMAQGLVDFRKMFKGELWLEFFVVPGVNDHDAEVSRIADVAKRIGADRIQVNTLDRPGAEPWVKPAAPETLARITRMLESGEVIESYRDAHEHKAVQGSLNDAIVAMVGRRPCTAEDMTASLGVDREEVGRALQELIAAGRVEEEHQARGCFYRGCE